MVTTHGKTGIILNDEDRHKVDYDELERLHGGLPPRGKGRKPDGTLIDLPMK